jgi:uncharacterized protein
MAKRCFLAVLTFVLFSYPARAAETGPSFDCSHVKPGSVEYCICKSPEVAKDDRDMADLYQQLKLHMWGNQRPLLIDLQRNWLRERQETFTLQPTTDTLHAFYQKRIGKLQGWLRDVTLGSEINSPIHYRNASYGFEFSYPGDMQVITSSTAASGYHTGSWEGQDRDIVAIIYAPYGANNLPYVLAEVSVIAGLTEEACMSYPNPPPDTRLRDVLQNQKLNGFFADKLMKEPQGPEWQDFRAYDQGNCLSIRRSLYRPTPQWSPDIEGRVDKAISHIHFGRLKDIVTSFQFLNNESTATLKSENPVPSFACANLTPGSVEEMICLTPELAQDDQEMARAYRELMSALPKDQRTKYQTWQQKWLQVRNNPSSRLAVDLHYMYRSRIARLKGWLYKATHEAEAKTLKTYRNEEYGFEFRVPADMQVETSKIPHHDEVTIDYHPYLSDISKLPYMQDPPNVGGRISIRSDQTDESCICSIYATGSNCPPSKIVNAPMINGFYVGDNLVAYSEGRNMAYQYFITSHNGKCFKIGRDMWFIPGPDEDEEAQDITLDSRTHYDQMKEMVKTFRFLDSQPKTTP